MKTSTKAIHAAAVLIAVLTMFASFANAGITADTQPEVYVEFSSRQAPVDLEKVRVFIDGRDVTAEADVLQWKVSWRSAEPMSPGVHHVRVIVVDMNGGRGVKRWSFTIDPKAGEKQKPGESRNQEHIPGEGTPDMLFPDMPQSRRNTDFYLRDLPDSTLERCIDVPGRALPYAGVSLVLNGAATHFETVDSAGDFIFSTVCLTPGENTLQAQITNVDGLPGEETPETIIAYSEPAALAALPEPDIERDEPDAGDTGAEAPPEEDTEATDNVEEPQVVPDTIAEPDEPGEPDEGVVPDDEDEDSGEDDPGEEVEPVTITLKHSHKGNLASGTAINFQGKTTPGAHVTLYVNGVPIAETEANSGGVFHFKKIVLPDGVSEVEAVTVSAGVTYESSTLSITVETDDRKKK